MHLVTGRFTISEKDPLMSREMNIPLLLSYFRREQNGRWGSLSFGLLWQQCRVSEVSGARKYMAWAWGGCSHGDASIVF